MSSTGSFEQYPRPGESSGPSLWEQPAFPATAQRTAPVPVTPAGDAAALDRRRRRGDSLTALFGWGRLAGASGLLAVMFALSGAATQITGFFAAAIVAGIAAAGSSVKAMTSLDLLLNPTKRKRKD